MKALVIAIGLLFATQVFAEVSDTNRGQLSEEMVKKALSQPKRYHFDDGGNIDFGNGFFKRRINFAGQAQVCHEDNIIYGGEGTKCLVKKAKHECKEYKTYTLKTQMVGTKVVCTEHKGGSDGKNNNGGSPSNPGNGSSPDSDNGSGPDSDNGNFFTENGRSGIEGCKKTTVVKFKRGPEVKVNVHKSSQMNGKGKNGKIGYTYITIPECNF